MVDIYTRGGDDGSTSLGSGERVRKDDARVELLGSLDEANALLGLARIDVVDSDVSDVLAFLQHRLFSVGSIASGARGRATLGPEDTEALEHATDRLSSRIGELRGFVLPGGDVASGRLDLARAVLRRAERDAVASSAISPLDPSVLTFLNRASDLLFVAARYVASGHERAWDPDLAPPH